MIPFLTGALHGLMLRDSRDFMKIVSIKNDGIDRFVIEFASGLALRVTITVAVEGPA